MEIFNSKIFRNILIPAIGFGIGGALWGWEAFRGTVGAEEVITNPFSYILGAIFLGIIGSASLVIFSKDIKKILKIIGVGIISWIIGFSVPAIFIDWMLIFGAGLLTPIAIFLPRDIFIKFSGLEPSLVIWHFWLGFLITGAIVGLFYALILKLKIQPLIWRSAVGFAIASLISPILGNLIGNNLLNSLFSAYIITFTLIGIIFGLFLAWGIDKSLSSKV